MPQIALVESFTDVRDRNFKIAAGVIPEIAQREHMARPYPGGDYDFLAINVPSTFQQGLIPDGEELPHGPLRIVQAMRQLHQTQPGYPQLNAGILDAHRLRLNPHQIGQQLLNTRARVVGLNPTSVNVPEALAIAEICDTIGIPYILGGIHATLDPQIARQDFPNAAAIIRGAGERVAGPIVRQLLDGTPSKPMPGVYYRESDHAKNLGYAPKLEPGDLPIVKQSELAEEPVYRHTVVIDGVPTEINEANLFVTWGCPFECVFCSSPTLVGRGVKGQVPYQRPPISRIVDEIEGVLDLGADSVHFLDDMAFITADHIRDLSTELTDRGLLGKFRWRGLTRAPVISRFDDETMRAMADTGAWKIALGVESGDDAMLRKIKKGVTTDEVRVAVSRLAQFGIQSKGFFIFGFPGETEEQMEATRKFILELKGLGMTEIAAFQFKPYPGTQAYDEVVAAQPDIIPKLNYLRRNDLSSNSKVQFRSEQHDTWLPDDVQIAAVPSDRVRAHVIGALEDFYGEKIPDGVIDTACI